MNQKMLNFQNNSDSNNNDSDLGSDSDTTLSLKADGVHGAFMGDIGAALAEKAVHEGGFPMVDVRNHRYVTETGRVQGGVLGSGGGSGGGRGGGEAASVRGDEVFWFRGGQRLFEGGAEERAD